MMLFRHPVITAPPPSSGPLHPAGLLPYFLAEHRTIFVWLFLCGLSVACADALVAVFIGKMVGFVGQADRWAAWHERWPALRSASGHRRCPAFSDLA
jgi:ATP-binding cassette subfamily B multidrug efflux pump